MERRRRCGEEEEEGCESANGVFSRNPSSSVALGTLGSAVGTPRQNNDLRNTGIKFVKQVQQIFCQVFLCGEIRRLPCTKWGTVNVCRIPYLFCFSGALTELTASTLRSNRRLPLLLFLSFSASPFSETPVPRLFPN